MQARAPRLPLNLVMCLDFTRRQVTAARPALLTSPRWRRAAFLLCAGLSLTSSGCGRQVANSSRLHETLRQPVFVISGGFGSCKRSDSKPNATHTFEHAKPTMDKLAKRLGHPVPYIASCFGFDHDIIRYQADDHLDTTAITPERFHEVISDRLERLGPDSGELVFVGHSWGGWLAMTTALTLAPTTAIAAAPIRYLGTIDPISWKRCTPEEFVRALIGGQGGKPANDKCIGRPTDLDPAYEHLAMAVNQWHQFYQDRYVYLHSGAIPAAPDNVHLDFDNLSPLDWKSHSLSGRDPRVWGSVEQELGF